MHGYCSTYINILVIFSLSSLSNELPLLPKNPNQTPSSLPLNSPPLLFSIQQLANFNGDPSSSFRKVRGSSGLQGGFSQTILDQVPQRISARSEDGAHGSGHRKEVAVLRGVDLASICWLLVFFFSSFLVLLWVWVSGSLGWSACSLGFVGFDWWVLILIGLFFLVHIVGLCWVCERDEC